MAEAIVDRVVRYRKGVTAFAGAASLAVSQGLIQGAPAKWIGIGIGFLTALGVYAVPNESLVAAPEASDPPATPVVATAPAQI